MEKLLYCPKCETARNCRSESREESYDVRGEKVSLMVPLWVCPTCKETIVDEAFGDPVEKAYDAYRKRHGLLPAGDVQRIREQWRLSQVSFATLLGMSQATINRYEQGALQQEKEDELIRACDNPQHMRDILVRRGHVLTERQRKAAEEALEPVRHPFGDADWMSVFDERMPQEVSARSGFRRFDFDRYAAIVVWFSRSVQAVTQTKLYKLLFYSDYLAFRTDAKSLTGAVYRAMPYGPVPVGFSGLRARMEMEDYIMVNEVTYQNGNTGEEFRPGSRAEEPVQVLTDEDLRILQFVRDRLGGLTPSQISDLSHKEAAWKDTPQKQVISYQKAMNLSLALPES